MVTCPDHTHNALAEERSYNFEELLEKKGGFVKIMIIGADLLPKCRNESNG